MHVGDTAQADMHVDRQQHSSETHRSQQARAEQLKLVHSQTCILQSMLRLARLKHFSTTIQLLNSRLRGPMPLLTKGGEEHSRTYLTVMCRSWGDRVPSLLARSSLEALPLALACTALLTVAAGADGCTAAKPRSAAERVLLSAERRSCGALEAAGDDITGPLAAWKSCLRRLVCGWLCKWDCASMPAALCSYAGLWTADQHPPVPERSRWHLSLNMWSPIARTRLPGMQRSFASTEWQTSLTQSVCNAGAASGYQRLLRQWWAPVLGPHTAGHGLVGSGLGACDQPPSDCAALASLQRRSIDPCRNLPWILLARLSDGPSCLARLRFIWATHQPAAWCCYELSLESSLSAPTSETM